MKTELEKIRRRCRDALNKLNDASLLMVIAKLLKVKLEV